MLRTGTGRMIDLYTRDEGEGPPMMLLHGFTGSGESMSQISESLSNRVIRPDLLGHGLSPAPEELDHYRIESMVDQLHRIVKSRVGGPTAICGYSMGARLALSYTVRYSRYVSALILIGGTAGIEDRKEAERRAGADAQLAARVEREGIAEFTHYWEHLPMFSSQFQLPFELRLTIRRIRLSQRPLGIANTLRMAGTGLMAPLWEFLPELHTPTLLITGSNDVKFTEIAQRMMHVLPHGNHVTIPNAGHAAHIENSHKVAGHIKAFLGKI